MRLLVFDGTAEAHDDGEPFSPLFVYGQNKRAGDIAVAGCPRYYIMRSSWVIGEGHNFVKTMKGLSDRVADPENKLTQITVADDNLGRLTFTRDMAAAIFHVLDAKAPYGTYGCTGYIHTASHIYTCTEADRCKDKYRKIRLSYQQHEGRDP